MLNTSLWKIISQPYGRSQNIAIRKPGKDAAIPTSYQPISLVCHTYKLYERIILNRIAPTIDVHLIKEHVGLRPRKSFTSKLLNIIQHIQDGYQESMTTGTAFVRMPAVKDTEPETLNHVK